MATLFWDTLYTSCAREDKDVYQKETKSVLVQILKSKCSPEASYVYSFLISPRQRELLRMVKFSEIEMGVSLVIAFSLLHVSLALFVSK